MTLTWSAPADHLLRAKNWRYEQSQGNDAVGYSTGSTATSHVVLGLTNGLAYSFRVRAILESNLEGCWSNAVEVTPVEVPDVLEAMKKHQGAIAANTSKMAAEMAVTRVVATELGVWGVGALEALAESADTMAVESTMLREELSEGLGGLSKKVEEAGGAVAARLADNGKKLKALAESADAMAVESTLLREELSEKVEEAGAVIAAGLADNGKTLDALAESADTMAVESTLLRGELSTRLDGLSEDVDQAGKAIAAGLARIEGKLGSGGSRGSGGPSATQLCGGEHVGSLYFDHDSYSLAGDDKNPGASRRTAMQLQSLAEGRLVLAVGYASAEGFATHNLHLSDMRAACTAQCLRAALGGQPRLDFREIALGEALEESDPRDNTRKSRRVDVVVCPDDKTDPRPRSDARSEIVDCGCPTGPLESHSAPPSATASPTTVLSFHEAAQRQRQK